jgi:hypothetical protein
MGDFPDITSPLGWDFREQDSGMMNLFRSKIRNQHSSIINPCLPSVRARDIGYRLMNADC